MPTVTLRGDEPALLIASLAEAAARTGDSDIVRTICITVATLITNAGRYGGTAQQSLMDAATASGFACEFIGRQGVRVTQSLTDDLLVRVINRTTLVRDQLIAEQKRRATAPV